MYNHIKELARTSGYFLENRWNTPLNNAQASERQSCLWPSSEEFYHPLNPMFAAFLTEPRHFSAFDIVLLRDGATTLLDFYMRFPTPKATRTIFFVPADLYFLVPDPWREQTLAYRMEVPETKPTKKLVLYSLISETFLGWNRFRYNIDAWLQQFPKDADVSAYFAIRNEPINNHWEDRQVSFEVTAAVQNYFEKKITFLTYDALKKQGAQSDATFVHMDLLRTSVGLCAIDNMFLGQSIKVLPRKTYKAFSGEKIGEWPMSFRHKLSLYKGDAPDSDYGTFFFMQRTNSYPMTPKLLDVINERYGGV
jgi:hypothetical protein